MITTRATALLGVALTTLLPGVAAALDSQAALKKLCVQWSVTDIWVHQSRKPFEPWDTSRGEQLHSLDLERERYALHNRHNGAGGYNFHFVTQVAGEQWRRGSFIYGDVRHRNVEAITDQAADLFLFTPPLLLAHLTEHGTPVGSSEAVRSISQTAFGPLELTFNADRQLTSTTVRLPSGGTRRLDYTDYRQRQGIQYPASIAVFYDGIKVWDVRVTEFLPATSCFDRVPDTDHLQTNTIQAGENVRAFSARELAPGVWFIGEGVFYQLFVEFDDHIVAIGSVGGVEKRVNALREHVPDKPLRYAVITHHHSDHLEGVAALVDLGATLLVAPEHEKIVRESTTGDLSITLIDDALRLGDGAPVLEIINLPNAHATQNLVAWLPENGILFSGDLWVQQPGRPIRAALAPTRDLAAALRARNIQPSLFVDPHSPRLNTAAELQTALEKAEDYAKRYGTLP